MPTKLSPIVYLYSLPSYIAAMLHARTLHFTLTHSWSDTNILKLSVKYCQKRTLSDMLSQIKIVYISTAREFFIK